MVRSQLIELQRSVRLKRAQFPPQQRTVCRERYDDTPRVYRTSDVACRLSGVVTRVTAVVS